MSIANAIAVIAFLKIVYKFLFTSRLTVTHIVTNLFFLILFL